MLTIGLSQWGTLEKLWGGGVVVAYLLKSLLYLRPKSVIFSYPSYFGPVSILQADPRQTKKPAISEQRAYPLGLGIPHNITYIM